MCSFVVLIYEERLDLFSFQLSRTNESRTLCLCEADPKLEVHCRKVILHEYNFSPHKQNTGKSNTCYHAKNNITLNLNHKVIISLALKNCLKLLQITWRNFCLSTIKGKRNKTKYLISLFFKIKYKVIISRKQLFKNVLLS